MLAKKLLYRWPYAAQYYANRWYETYIRFIYSIRPGNKFASPYLLTAWSWRQCKSIDRGNGNAAPHRVWLEIAEREKLILVIPSGALSPDGNPGWNDCRADAESNPKTDDVKFIRALIQNVAKSCAIDRSRIFASGMSNGGNMALRLALELSDQIAAVAVVASAMPKVNICGPPAHPVSVLFMNGTADPLLPYEGEKWQKAGVNEGT